MCVCVCHTHQQLVGLAELAQEAKLSPTPVAHVTTRLDGVAMSLKHLVAPVQTINTHTHTHTHTHTASHVKIVLTRAQ